MNFANLFVAHFTLGIDGVNYGFTKRHLKIFDLVVAKVVKAFLKRS